jgi:hypothetical protein
VETPNWLEGQSPTTLTANSQPYVDIDERRSGRGPWSGALESYVSSKTPQRREVGIAVFISGGRNTVDTP